MARLVLILNIIAASNIIRGPFSFTKALSARRGQTASQAVGARYAYKMPYSDFKQVLKSGLTILDVNFGVGLQGKILRSNFQDIKRIALKADELGFHSIWASDHLMHPFPVEGMPKYYCHEAWTLMSALAALTKSVRLGFCVLIPVFRYPSVLAKMAATLDIISKGRIIMSLGAGWFKQEYDAYGIPWEEHDDRVKREREAALVMKAVWTQPVASFSGKYYHVKEAVIEPKPLQKPYPPIWISGNSPKTMEVVAELADGWFMHPTSSLKESIACMKKIVQGRHMHYATLLGEPPLGKPSECIEKIWEYVDAGITLCKVDFRNTKSLELFARDVLPNFKPS